jgi:hypothetical protein
VSLRSVADIGIATPQTSSRPRALLHAVAPEGPEGAPLFWDVGEAEGREPQEAIPDMDVIGTPGHREGAKTAPAGLAVEQGGCLDDVGVEHL